MLLGCFGQPVLGQPAPRYNRPHIGCLDGSSFGFAQIVAMIKELLETRIRPAVQVSSRMHFRLMLAAGCIPELSWVAYACASVMAPSLR